MGKNKLKPTYEVLIEDLKNRRYSLPKGISNVEIFDRKYSEARNFYGGMDEKNLVRIASYSRDLSLFFSNDVNVTVYNALRLLRVSLEDKATSDEDLKIALGKQEDDELLKLFSSLKDEPKNSRG